MESMSLAANGMPPDGAAAPEHIDDPEVRS